MKSDHLNSAIQAVNNIISNLLNKKIYKQQLTELQKYLDDLGWDIERHVYRSLFTTLLSTPFNDSAKLSLLQQLYLDIGPIFSRHNFHSLVQFALQFDPLSTNTRLGIRSGSASNKSGGGANLLDLSSGDSPSSSVENKNSDQQFTSFDTSSSNSSSSAASVAGTSDRAVNPGLVAKVNDISKLLKLSETEKFALLVCLNEHNCCEREIDLEKCQFSTSSEITHFILSQLTISNSPRANNLSLKIQEELSVRLPTDKKESSVAFLHTPFTETLAMSSSLPSSVSSMSEDQITDMIIRESGGQLTSDMLRQFDVTPSLCAKLLFALCETSRIDTQGTGTSAQVSNSREMKTIEDIESLANVCREFIPSASPLTDIIRAIDSDSFIPLNSKLFSGKSGKVNRFWHFCYSLCNTDKQGLSLLGMLFFSQLWSYNLEFQYKIIENCIKLNVVAKLLSGGHSDLGQLVPQIDSLKVQPEIEGHLLEISNWKFQKVYQILVDLSTTGPVSPINDMSVYFSNVIEALRWPLQHCPDLVALGMLGCQGSISAARQKILGLTIPPLLSNNANAAVILHLMWSLGDPSPPTAHNQWSKDVLLRSMCDYYNSSHEQNEQQQRLSRILDVAQDLKALGHLLNMNSYPFVIDLACLASRREYLKLDKWLWDKVQSVGEPFIRQAVLFTAKRCPALIQGGCAIEPGIPAIIHLPSETLATLLACLHKTLSLQSSAPLPKDLNENILKMVNNSALLLQNASRQQQLPPSVLSSSSGPSSIVPPSVLRMNPQASPAAAQQQQQTVGDLAFGMGNINLASNPSLGQSQLAMQQRLPFLNNVMNPLNPAPNPDRLRQAFGDLASIFPDVQQNVSPEIEREADTYFQRIYNQSAAGSMSIDDVLEMLRRFQDSSNQREKEVFTCMIRNLFKEYCYFPQYPEKELLITAQLFGGIIQMGLVKYMALVVALRYVLEALRKPYRSKMYFFGIAALDRFKTKLKDYPLYCQHLASIAHFEDFPVQLVEYVKYGAQSMEPPARVPQIADLSAPPISVAPPVQAPQIPVTAPVTVPPKVTKPGTGGVASTDPSILLDHTHETLKPPETTQDRVAFIINNLSQMNLHQKTEEFRDVIAKESKYHPWIAHYFVVKRASIELNFHTLYSNFIDLLKSNEITELIIRETFRNIKVLLQNDKEVDNFNDRSLLKTLGHWLGMLTLAKSRPILALDINFKFLLIEAFHKGPHELLHVVPFTAKVLESCAKSKVFKPPNPWTMGLLRTLAELHQEPDTKLNLKFEVEVLCKALSVDLKELFGISNYFQRSDLRERVLGPDSQLGKKKLVAPNLPQIGAGSGTWVSGPSAGKQEEFPSVLPSQPEKSKAGGSSPPQPIIPSPGAHTFNYHEIPLNIAQLVSFYNVPNVPLFQHSPTAKSLIKPAIERAITEWVAPVVERSMKISIITAEQIIKKDFALESDENKMCLAAHHLIRSLTAGMGMITSKETLFLSIVNNLVNGFSRTVTNAPKEMIETAAHAVASENIDLAVCFIQKTAVEKAKIELDKRLAPEYESRKRARAEGRRFCDPATLTYQAERMPEAIRLKVGSVPAHQFHVYEDIGRNIPGFISPVVDPPTGSAPVINRQLAGFQMPPAAPTPSFPAEEQVNNHDSGLVNLYDKLVSELETLLGHFAANQQPSALIQTMHNILETVAMARSNPRDIVGALNLIQRVLDAIAELLFSIDSGIVDMTLTSRGRDLYLVILKALADQRAYGHQWTTKQITRLVLERLLTNQAQSAPLPDELFDVLMRSMLINLPLLDHNLAQAIESAQSAVALAFTLQFVKIYGQQGLQEREIAGIIGALVKLAKTAGGNLAMEIQQVLDVFRSSGPETMVVPRPEEPTDPPEFHDKTERLLRDWIAMYNSSADLNKVFSIYVQQMNHQGILKTDDSITRFFRLSTELCVEHCYRILTANQPQTQQTVLEARSKCFQILDAFAHLIVMLVKHSGQHPAAPAETQAKLNLLSKVLSIIAQVAIHDQEVRAENFQHLPYYRIFIILFMEVTLGANYLGNPSFAMGMNQAQLDPLVETIQFQVLSAFCHTLRILKPSKVPSFAYAWLDFISHRTFMDKCLNGPTSGPATGSPKGWSLYAQLLIELIKFLAPFLRSVELSGPVDLLYKVNHNCQINDVLMPTLKQGTLKVLLVLLHDFPEFLCEFCYEICDSIPCNAIQMRNLVLSAFPRNMRLPDPFTPNLKIDSLPEITLTPKGTSTAVAALSTVAFKKDLDSYLRNRSPVTFLSELRGYLQQSSQVDSIRYNIPLINALVLYVGQAAIQTITPKHINMTAIAHSSHMDIFQNLAVDLDTEGRYLFLNAIANQLRYPNSYTHYFSCTLLYLFAESNTEAIQEQITRVLLERLIVNRPHPWGLLITFIELIKNPAFKFWSHEFVRCAPEIEKLFESVAKSCMQMAQSKVSQQPQSQSDGSDSGIRSVNQVVT